ncbi:hypothetical protein AB670_03981 [Chryseobacterium sp. MOF25P]|uniref:endonuclease domain-containing protein n=1 Tax=unclassified Chryseobacterium TaxID=2593645 RepID=UPI000804A7FB|nr:MULTISPECIES: endonuclease domain-containing protein [unclassified Chryseobacterium]OBW39674.1 hypothetical protein AB670_03981 [Chryseobacterium sp. MOF25P]OBW43779.1 hypothetical protein AB671_04134 [Chryseobacterium sp. BGARF1]
MKEILSHINGIPIRKNFMGILPYNPDLKLLLSGKRKAKILGEVIFWQRVWAHTFHKIDFDRQRIIGNYVVDFYVKRLGLVVEIDGWSHDFKKEYDKTWHDYLESLGLKVFRVSDFDVKNNLDFVMRDLESFIIEHYAN